MYISTRVSIVRNVKSFINYSLQILITEHSDYKGNTHCSNIYTGPLFEYLQGDSWGFKRIKLIVEWKN